MTWICVQRIHMLAIIYCETIFWLERACIGLGGSVNFLTKLHDFARVSPSKCPILIENIQSHALSTVMEGS